MASRKRKAPTPAAPSGGTAGIDASISSGLNAGASSDTTVAPKAEVGIGEGDTTAPQPAAASDLSNVETPSDVPASEEKNPDARFRPADPPAAQDEPATVLVEVDSPYTGGLPLMVEGRLVTIPNNTPTAIPASHIGALRDSGCPHKEH